MDKGMNNNYTIVLSSLITSLLIIIGAYAMAIHTLNKYIMTTPVDEPPTVAVIADTSDEGWASVARILVESLNASGLEAKLLNATLLNIESYIASKTPIIVLIVHTAGKGYLVTMDKPLKGHPRAVLPNNEERLAIHPKVLEHISPATRHRYYLIVTCNPPGSDLLKALSKHGVIVYATGNITLPSSSLVSNLYMKIIQLSETSLRD